MKYERAVRPSVGTVIDWLITGDTNNDQGIYYFGNEQILAYLLELPYLDYGFKELVEATDFQSWKLLKINFQFEINNLPLAGYVKCEFIFDKAGNEPSVSYFVGRYSTDIFMDLLIQVHALSKDESEPFDDNNQAYATRPSFAQIEN